MSKRSALGFLCSGAIAGLVAFASSHGFSASAAADQSMVLRIQRSDVTQQFWDCGQLAELARKLTSIEAIVAPSCEEEQVFDPGVSTVANQFGYWRVPRLTSTQHFFTGAVRIRSAEKREIDLSSIRYGRDRFPLDHVAICEREMKWLNEVVQLEAADLILRCESDRQGGSELKGRIVHR